MTNDQADKLDEEAARVRLETMDAAPDVGEPGPAYRLPFRYVADDGHVVQDAEGKFVCRCGYQGVAESIAAALNAR